MINRPQKYTSIATDALQPKGGLRLLWVLLLGMAGMACTQERQPCLTPKVASLNLRFVHFAADSNINNNTASDTGLPKAVFRAVSDSGNITRIAIAPSAYFTISLSPVADSCKWLFKADSAVAEFDTLSFRYNRQLQFLSNACGYTYFYQLVSARALPRANSAIDSILILNSSVTNDVNTRQLQIYMHPGF